MKKQLGTLPLGVWIALLGILLQLLAWAMQAYSLLNWEHAVELGLQNDRFTGDAAEQAWALESWGLAMTDLVWALPIGLVAFVGILRKKFHGFTAGMMELAIGVYWPVMFAFQRWDLHRETAVVALLLWVPVSLLGIWGLWKNERLLSQRLHKPLSGRWQPGSCHSVYRRKAPLQIFGSREAYPLV